MESKYSYNPARYNPKAWFKLLPEGQYRVRVSSVEPWIARSSKREGFKVTLAVSGNRPSLRFYITIDANDPAYTDQKLGQFFDCFGIPQPAGVLKPSSWVGHMGAVYVKHNFRNGQDRADVAFLIPPQQHADLPPWEDPISFPPPKASPSGAGVGSDGSKASSSERKPKVSYEDWNTSDDDDAEVDDGTDDDALPY